ncbi:MAG: 4Fe-4S dicluster domain-containing protein [Melioribacteraceae bacterium]|nr:4Fe-4S dicluster domain-containing protein [Melioribacteraceae bacterium]
MSLEKKIFDAGVIGAGGGGFPTHIKAKSNVEYILANGAECEPLIHKDVELMENFGEEIISGMELMISSTGASKSKFGLKAKNSKAVANIRDKVSNSTIEVLELGDYYPAGDEYELVYEATKRLIPAAGIPLDVDCVVNNVETFYNVYNANKGIPVTKKLVTVTGMVKKPSTFFVPIGITYREIIEFAGGLKIKDFAIMESGILMGSLSFDLDKPVTKTCSGIIVLPKDHYLIKRLNRSQENQNKIGKSACDQCSFCTELCPRYLLGYDVQPHKVMRSLEFTTTGEDFWNQYAELCCSCGLCSLYSCPEDLYPREACDQAKVSMKSKDIKFTQTKPVEVHPIKDGRRVPMKQLMKKLDITQYNVKTPFTSGSPAPTKVKLILDQHIGVPSEPCVKVGAIVNEFDLIADAVEGKLSAKVHASISGTVKEINENYIIIEK